MTYRSHCTPRPGGSGATTSAHKTLGKIKPKRYEIFEGISFWHIRDRLNGGLSVETITKTDGNEHLAVTACRAWNRRGVGQKRRNGGGI